MQNFTNIIINSYELPELWFCFVLPLSVSHWDRTCNSENGRGPMCLFSEKQIRRSLRTLIPPAHLGRKDIHRQHGTQGQHWKERNAGQMLNAGGTHLGRWGSRRSCSLKESPQVLVTWAYLLRGGETQRGWRSRREARTTLQVLGGWGGEGLCHLRDGCWKDWCWSWNSNTLATWCEELTLL